MAKARVAPIKPVTIPRLELTAALVSVKVSSLLLEELPITNVIEWFWTDSNVVLCYISNDSRRFHVFVANRVQQIRDHSEPFQWNYISSAENPADIASRGATVEELKNRKMWLNGPTFLWESKKPFDPTASSPCKPALSEDDPEVKRGSVFNVKVECAASTTMLEQLKRFSDWTKVKRIVALCLKFKLKCKISTKLITVTDLQEAETAIVRLVQDEAFPEEINTLKGRNQGETRRRSAVSRASPTYKLDPFLDEKGIIRVGGRIRNGEFDFNTRHPIILPRKSHITELIIETSISALDIRAHIY